MAKQPTKEKLEDEEESSSDASHDEEDDAKASTESKDDPSDSERDEDDESDEDEDEDSEDDESDESAEDDAPKPVAKKALAKKAPVEDDEEEEEDDDEELAEKPELAARSAEDDEAVDEEEVVLPTQLGTQRYIFAAYFVGGMLMAYVIGRAIHGIWSHYANRDFFVSAVPQLAAIPDETKQTYATILAALITLAVIVRTYRKPDIRKWTEDVTSEMTKVKWPTRKEVTSSTIVVITASAIATAYLFLLDRLWSFVTGLVYGAGT